ncbi:hypothetical protein [Gulbenkiania mobilis]|uniref:hypothetical protein n=1 Tax=Gulbenkiania mobilis TaxID=397457 RepID=UPI000AFBFF64|nr:hypothetical protein [Gulbenkiania mobilis]
MQIFDMNTKEGRDAVAAYEKQREAMTTKGQQLYAKIKRSSKYYGQTKPHEVFCVYIVAEHGYGDYVVQGGPGGQYRLSDVNLFVIQDGFQQRIA